MKAIVFDKYGPPEVLRLKEVEKPTPKDNEVLVRIHAASVNSWDWGLMRGKPFLNRMIFGLIRPKIRILGIDIAGRVEGVGRNAKQFQPGDEVFGDMSECGMGGFAEYIAARENALSHKPARMTFEEAAAIPHTAALALQGLRDKGHIEKGQKVLINGAGGGAGTFGIQIAKLIGAEVTCVDRPEKFDMLRAIGADRVIDYTREDFTKDGPIYDLILDVVTYRSIFDYRRSLAPKGTYVMLGGGSWGRVYQAMFFAPIISMTGRKKMRILVHKPNKDLIDLKELFEAGQLFPVIDRCYPLDEVPEAIRYLGEGRTKGKVIITMEGNHKTRKI